MHRGFGRDKDTGVHTVEGTVAGGRAGRLTKQREEDQKAFEEKKAQIEADAARGLGRIDDKFDRTVLNTVLSGGGLQTAAEYRAAAEGVGAGGTSRAAPAEAEPAAPKAAPKKDGRAAKRARAKQRAMLSFGDEEEEAAAPPPAKALKCPDADTDFLPDRHKDEARRAREAELAEEQRAERHHRERSRSLGARRGAVGPPPSARVEELFISPIIDTSHPRRFRALQERRRKATIEVVYSYWDGSGHRRELKCEAGTKISAFLERARAQCEDEFPELKRVSVENLLYVKHDLVIPNHLSFHDLAESGVKGFKRFDVHEDVRVGGGDVRVESTESHPGRVVMRAWFERNKHIFPASRWRNYDPNNPEASEAPPEPSE
mmetsp:Transcript_3164/g.9270  ORF Transcript_3164/g.9270 Transcript_3164/m.9270 type:complete len:375 (-) Transcript_3164:45-1169(-)